MKKIVGEITEERHTFTYRGQFITHIYANFDHTTRNSSISIQLVPNIDRATRFTKVEIENMQNLIDAAEEPGYMTMMEIKRYANYI